MIDYQFKYYRRDKDFSGLSRKVVVKSSFFEGKVQLTEIHYRYNGNIIGYENSVRDLFSHSITHIVRIGKQTTRSLEKLIQLKEKYTLKSIQKRFNNTRAVGNFIVNGTAYYRQENNYYPVSFNPATQTLSIMTRCSSKNAPDLLVKKNLQILTNLADRLWRDLNDIGEIDLDALERKVMLRQVQKRKSNPWGVFLNFALKVGAKFGVAMIAGAVGGKIDLPDDAFDFDIDVDADIDSDCQYTFDSDSDYGYNIAFGASENSDGYIPDGTISLERTISGGSDSFPHYTKDGHDYVKLGPGNYVRIDQGNTVNLRGVKYDTV